MEVTKECCGTVISMVQDLGLIGLNRAFGLQLLLLYRNSGLQIGMLYASPSFVQKVQKDLSQGNLSQGFRGPA